MKTIFFVLQLIFIGAISGQTITKSISKTTIGPLTCDNTLSIKEEDSTYYVALTFQNQEYAQIVDIGGVFFFSPLEIEKFKSDLSKALPFIGQDENDATFEGEDYRLQVYTFNKSSLYLYDEAGKYCYLNKKRINDLIEWLSTAEFK